MPHRRCAHRILRRSFGTRARTLWARHSNLSTQLRCALNGLFDTSIVRAKKSGAALHIQAPKGAVDSIPRCILPTLYAPLAIPHFGVLFFPCLLSSPTDRPSIRVSSTTLSLARTPSVRR
eukprot:scaffold43720_cov30-Tisochrysis_lutea.AAC.6